LNHTASSKTISAEKNMKKLTIALANKSMEAQGPTSQLYRSGIKKDMINESSGRMSTNPSILFLMLRDFATLIF
jgi:hypothetical protein